jgi:hypothetical protein
MQRELATVLTLSVFATTTQASVLLDGVRDGNDTSYTNTEVVTWYNGHKADESLYGEFDSQTATTTIRYGSGEFQGDISGTQYFFLFLEAPLIVKNMIWDSAINKNNFLVANGNPAMGLTEDDVSSYRVHHETHHKVGDLKLDFKGATGSEKVVFVDSDGDAVAEANLNGDPKNFAPFGLLDFKDSVDYLFDNSISTEALSLARNRTMSFEFRFDLDTVKNEAFLDYIRNGIEFHLSPERGLPVPEPTTLAVLGLSVPALLRRRGR